MNCKSVSKPSKKLVRRHNHAMTYFMNNGVVKIVKIMIFRILNKKNPVCSNKVLTKFDFDRCL